MRREKEYLLKMLLEKISKKEGIQGWECRSVVEFLPSMYKILGLISTTPQKR